MLKPTVDDPSKADPNRVKDADPAKVQMLQQKVRMLVESPLYFAGDLFDNDLIS